MLRPNRPCLVQRLNGTPITHQLGYANQPVGNSRARRTNHNSSFITRMFTDNLSYTLNCSSVRERATAKFQDLHECASDPAVACAANSISADAFRVVSSDSI